MPVEQQIIGVDFSSAPTNRKPITVAVGFLKVTRGNCFYMLHEVIELPTLKAFEAFLEEPQSWIGGFDLPFGQPRALIEHQGWPTDWAAFVQFYCNSPKEQIREVFRRWCDGRPPGSKFAWRKTDKPAGSSPAMRWTNPPVAWMMHAGIGRMVAAGLEFPAHEYPGGSLIANPVRPRFPHFPSRQDQRSKHSAKIALEAYPGFTARKITRGSYKSDTPAAWTEARRLNRHAIVTSICAGTAGLSIKLKVNSVLKKRLVDDPKGDLLDAVICALQAGHAAMTPDFGLPQDLDPLEGWIASVPPSTG